MITKESNYDIYRFDNGPVTSWFCSQVRNTFKRFNYRSWIFVSRYRIPKQKKKSWWYQNNVKMTSKWLLKIIFRSITTHFDVIVTCCSAWVCDAPSYFSHFKCTLLINYKIQLYSEEDCVFLLHNSLPTSGTTKDQYNLRYVWRW